jgi:hypothetical protein
MSGPTDDTERVELTARQAELVGRQFNSAVTNAVAYSVDHPVAQRAVTTFLGTLEGVLEICDPVTLMLDRGSFFVEDHPVDARFNARRLAIVFRSLGLESVSFAAGTDVDAMTVLMQVFGAGDEEYDDIDAVRAALDSAGVESIRVNHVVLRKFTADDEVVGREGLEELTDLAEQAVSAGASARERPEDGESLAERIERVFSLAALVRNPERAAGELVAAGSEQGVTHAELAQHIRVIGERVGESSAAETGSLDPDEVMDALAVMRRELSEALAGQEELARLMGEQGGVLDEVDQLTCRTIVSILREELRSGEASPQRLAQIIRRVLPETEDLRRLLPTLKQGLLEEGMAIDDYVAFVNELTGELQDEGVVQALAEGAEGIGLSVEEILREIRRDPGEAARLVVLASELRSIGSADEDRLSDALIEYVERVSGELAAGEGNEGRALRDDVRKKQESLLAGLRAQGIDDSVAERVESALKRRLDGSTDSLRTSRLVELLSHSEALPDPEVADRLARIVERESNLRTLGDTLQRELEVHGYSAERIDSIYNETLARLKRRSRVEFVPGSVMNPVATNYFLQREIATALRYETHFSCIMLMVARVREPESEWRTISLDEIELIMPEVFDILPPHLRDLDLLGTLGTKDRNIPLAILPMTDQPGAEAVMKRMLAALNDAHIELSGAAAKVDVLGTAHRFDAEQASDAKSFVQIMKGRLASQLVTSMRMA